MKLTQNLLFAEEESDYVSALNGTNIKGSYNTMRFVLRLRDDVRKALNDSDDLSERIQASSTSIHENIHWWQHIGSNFGFLFSLAYPAFVHETKKNLDNLIAQDLAYKSIIKFDLDYYKKNGRTDIRDVNTILNNYYDLEYAKAFALDNKNLTKISDDLRFFLNIGHCYHIFWSLTIGSLAATIDREYCFLPKIDDWVENFKNLDKDKIQGFYIDTPMNISPIGIKAIYEGQAIFNQIQYLTVALNKDLSYQDFEDAGMLHGIYIEAFELFLKITNLEKPTNLLDPIVGLFLLVCDLSINPTNGFPLDIHDYKNFINKNDPGMRFGLLSSVIAKNPLEYVGKVSNYSKQEYISLSKNLSESIGCKCPYESINILFEWAKNKEVKKVLHEESELKYSIENLPIRLMFSKYYRFQEDKFEHPNVFCWFGFHSTSENPNVDHTVVHSLFNKHHALFVEDYDGEIKPTHFGGKKEENIAESFNYFYKYNILYDLILKWVYEEGDFTFDYKWLANERSESIIPAIKTEFEIQFGISMDKIIIK